MKEVGCLGVGAWEGGGGAQISTTLSSLMGVVESLGYSTGAHATIKGSPREDLARGLLEMAFFGGPP